MSCLRTTSYQLLAIEMNYLLISIKQKHKAAYVQNKSLNLKVQDIKPQAVTFEFAILSCL